MWMRPSQYDDGAYPITKRLIEDGARTPSARSPDRNRLPGAHPAGRARSGRAVAPRGRTRLAARAGRRRADAGQGRRPSAVAAGRYRTADRCGAGIVGWVERSETHRLSFTLRCDGFRLQLNPSCRPRAILPRPPEHRVDVAPRAPPAVAERAGQAPRPRRREQAARCRRGAARPPLQAQHRRCCRSRSKRCARTGRGRCA